MNDLFKKILSILFLSSCLCVNAQVTMGSGADPADYAILQIDGTEGGLRLPKLNSEAREQLTAAFRENIDEVREGMVIYYTDKNEVQFWNGENWISMLTAKELTNSINGIVGTDNFKLGGELSELTTIIQPNNSYLYFDVTSGMISVGNNALVVDSVGVSIGTKPTNAAFDVKSIEEGGLKILTPELKDIEFEVGPGEKDIKDTYVLTSDAQGNVSWQSMLAVPTTFDGQWVSGIENISINSTSSLKLATVELTKGTWLITARYVAKSDGRTTLPRRYSNVYQGIRADGTYGNLAWIMFGKDGLEGVEAGSTQLEASIGILPACDGVVGTSSTHARGYISAVPYMTCILELETGGTYALYGNLYDRDAGSIKIKSTNRSVAAEGTDGYSYFTAIKLSAN